MKKIAMFFAALLATIGAMAQTYTCNLTDTKITSAELNAKTEATYIAIKNLSATNNYYFVGNTGAAPYSKAAFSEDAVFVWEPVAGETGKFYLKKLDGTYMQASSPKDFGTVANAAVFTTTNPTSKGSGATKFNGDGDSQGYIDGNDDANLVRFVATNGKWINVQNGDSGTPTYNTGEGGWTIHYAYAVTVHTFSADKVYYIQWKNTGANYITENRDKSLTVADKKNSNYQFWKLIPTDKSHCYKVQNVVTGNYLGSCDLTPSSSSRVNTSADAVEYYIGATAGGGNIAGCHYFSSTDCDNYSDETASPRALNKDGASSYIITWTAGLQDNGTSYKEGSYWKIVETTDEYERPVPPAHADASKALTVYFRPCGVTYNTYLTAATIGGVDPIAYAAAAKPGSFHVPFSKDRGAVVRGSNFNISITLSSADDADLKANAYFDWNDDGEFETTEPITLNGTAGTATVNVPADAVSGDTRMRIRLNSNGLDYADDDVEGFVYDFPLTVVDATTERKVYLDVNGDRNGTATLSAAGDSHVVGTQLTATATPKGNATFESWREGGVVVSTDAEYTFTVEDRNMTLKAYFTPNTGTPAQWDFTFNRTSESEATVAVTRDGEVVEGVTATIAIEGADNYLTADKLNKSQNVTGYTNGMGILCINRNTDGTKSTEADPNKYILTITNDTEEAFAFSYAEFYGVGVTGGGDWQSAYTSRQRYFKVKHGDTTLDPSIVSINDANHCNGKETINGFNADMVVPAGGTYAIELAIYGGSGITGDFALGCFYGLTKIALGAVPHYAVTVEGTEEAEGGVVYGNTTYKDASTLNATLSLAQSELAAAPVEGYLASNVTLDKALGTILVTYQPCITTQWDITFNRISTTEATASVTRGDVAVEGVTATIAMSTNYKTEGKFGSERTDLLCSTTNSANATEAEPIKYTLTITNNTDKICLFDYIEVSDVALDNKGVYQTSDVNRVRNFKVTYGGTTIGPEERYICDAQHSGGKEYPQGFGAKVSIPAKGTYTIVLEIYGIGRETGTNQIGSGCFYGLSKIALGNTAVSFGTTGYATLYAPIALTIPEGVTAYTGALEENNTWLTLNPIGGNTIPKEHAVILEGTAGNKFTLEAATEAGTIVSNNALKGQTSTVAKPTSGTVYTLQSYDENEDGTNESVIFRKYLGDKVNGGRAYLVIPEQAAAQAVRVRKFNTPTVMEMPTANGQQPTSIYDLQGRRVMNPTKGVYIVNGKKVVIK